MIGFFDFRTPTYMARDAGLINQIGIEQFDHFIDRDSFLDIETGAMYGKSLVFMCGNEWRAMRSTLTPAFTSIKLRNMFEFSAEAAHEFTQSLVMESLQHGGQVCSEIIRLFGCYSADITASYAFGLKIRSFENPTNEFFVNGSAASDFSGVITGLRIIPLALFPKLMRAVDFEIVPQHIRTFFRSAILNTMTERTEKQIVRSDLVATLMAIRNKRLNYENNKPNVDDAIGGGDNNNRQWTDDELVAQCFITFVSNFHSSTKAIAFMAYELALNQDIQQKLYEEIQMVNESLGDGQLTFDALSKLKYLDQVIDETLRKWPPATLTTRKCTKDIELDLGDGKIVSIERGTGIWIPIHSVHNDPNNFENPTEFDPERFNEENRHKIKSGSYIPFGIGLRKCIGETVFFLFIFFFVIF